MSDHKNDHDKHDHDRGTEIVVNGRKKTVTSKELTFDQVVRLAYEQVPSGPNVLFTITFRVEEEVSP